MHVYEVVTPVLGLAVLICCISGGWGYKECGKIDTDNEKAIPWITNIYQITEDGGHEFICSGTLVATEIILTAARCFYNDLTLKLKTGKYALSVGRKYRAWGPNDENVQQREISHENVILPDKYNGIATLYARNVAIVKLQPDQKFMINAFAKRACVYWDNDFRESELEENLPPLKLMAWKNGDNSSLETLNPSYLNFDICHSSVPKNFQTFLTVDKMCFQLKEPSLVPSIGSGLYAYNKAKSRWYLVGITSEVISVDDMVFITFANMNLHLNWISNTAFLHIE